VTTPGATTAGRRPLRVCTFAGASSLPLYVAAERGIFGRAGLEVELVATRSSDELMSGLLDGAFDIVHAAPDNYVSWRDRTEAPIVAWIGGTSGPVSLVARPGTAGVADLRGRDIAVDAVASGFVSVLRRILAAAGLGVDDVRFVPVGATNLRFAALRDGQVAATMLTLPWSLLAAEAGCIALADQRDVLPRLQGSCGASLEPWLNANTAAADAYLGSIVAALTWAYTPGNEAATTAVIATRYGIDPRHAEAVRVAVLDPVTGWPPSAYIDPAGMAEVCRLRAENDQPPASPTSAYYTLAPYGRVLGLGISTEGPPA
jgi:ABC-type nitrate/sulfonate/bicarbonate transport system substrate-binding protein